MSALGAFLPFLDIILPKISARYAGFSVFKSHSFISSLLAFAAGILSFLSLGDLYPEAVSAWSHAGFIDARYAGLIVFAFMVAVFVAMSILQRLFEHRHGHDAAAATAAAAAAMDEKGMPISTQSTALRRLGIQVAVALAIHNFPEGLATFTLALTSTKIGILFGIALALHKIPEGMIIALPVYAATESKIKASVFAAAMAIVPQVLGAVLGYVLFVTYWNQAVSGSLLSIAVALLVWVVYGGMIPMARSFDPKDEWCTKGLIMGVLFFALVNSLFSLAGADA